MTNRRHLGAVAVGFGASPFVVRARKSSVPVVGFVSASSSDGFAYLAAAFRQGLQESGFVVGQSLEIEYRWGDEHYERLPALAAELVQRQVSVLVGGGGAAGAPGGCEGGPDDSGRLCYGPAAPSEGLVVSLNRPGGNVTGVALFSTTLDAKRLGLLHETVPGTAVIAVLVNLASAIAGGRR